MTDTTYESILDLRIGGWDYDPGELLDRLEAAEAAADEHDQCPAQMPRLWRLGHPHPV